MGETESFVQALRKLSEKNLSNLMPHWLYSSFYYSHPTLLERERALGIPAPKISRDQQAPLQRTLF
jgi:STE24 endopeptidase